MTNNNQKYVKRLREKALEINDVELTFLVNKLLAERDKILNDLKLDALTGMYNRNILDDILNYSVVVMCDIDDFKNINDTFGHNAGDMALKTLSKTLVTNTRIYDYICRYGGDEFLIIFDDCNLDVVYNRIQRIKEDLSRPVRNEKFSINISVGIAQRSDGESLEDTIMNADIALYESKNSGKNQISVYNPEKPLRLVK